MRHGQVRTDGGQPTARRHVPTLLGATLILLSFALALSGGAFASSSAGWAPQDAGATLDFADVACTDDSHAWAVGRDERGGWGGIFATTDGGATWRAQYSGALLMGVTFANASDGWAVGRAQTGSGTIFATTDGGATWKPQYADDNLPSLEDVACTDASHAWAVGYGTILATTDGGATWKPQYSGAGDEVIHAVAFANPSDGWAVGYHANLSTTDGGATWTAQSAGEVVDLYDVACTDASHAWAVASGGLLATTDGGATWRAQKPNVTAALQAVAFADSNHGWAVGESSAETGYGTILATTDGGVSWFEQTNTGNGQILEGIACADATHAWAVGAYGSIVATANGGLTTPTLTGFVPSSGLEGADVTLSGSGLGGATAVRFGGVAATYFVHSTGLITATVPRGARTGKITVTTPGGRATSAARFTVVVTPALTLKLGGLTSGVLRLGKRVTMSGKATPSSLAGKKVALTVYRRSGYEWWVKVASLGRTITRAGTYSGTYKPARKGRYRVRATVAAAATNTAARTTWRTFRVR
jgi:photosystem II stability/assembly factor-like uncharacterized protein